MSDLHSNGKTETFKTSGQEMGYTQELKAFIDCAAGKAEPDVSTTDMFATMDVVFAIERALATGQTVSPSAIKVAVA